MADAYYFPIADTVTGNVWEDLLRSQILNQPSITKTLRDVFVNYDANVIRVVFLSALSAAEQTDLAGVIAAHDSSLEPSAPPGATSFTCPATVAVGDAVYVSAADVVDKATSLDVAKAAIGLVLDKPSATTAIVVDSSDLPVFAGLLPGESYFLGTVAGSIVASAPPPSAAFTQRLGYAKNATTLKAQVV